MPANFRFTTRTIARLTLVALGCFTGLTSAQETALPLWEAGVFATTLSTPAYPASTDRTGRALVLPFFIYRGEILRADRGTLGARVVHTDDVEVDVGFAASLPANSNDVSARAGMDDLGTLIEFGPRLKATIARPTQGSRVRFDLPVRTVLEVNGGVRSQGFAVEPEINLEVRDLYAGWRLSTAASLIIGDARLNQYFYGVPTNFATAQRPTYEAQAGLIGTRLSVSTAKSLTRDLRVFAFARHENYQGSANRNSPLYLQTTGNSAGLGLMWTLGRSSEMAKD